jgi:hypothetical protein
MVQVPGYMSKTFSLTCQAGIYIITAVTEKQYLHGYVASISNAAWCCIVFKQTKL